MTEAKGTDLKAAEATTALTARQSRLLAPVDEKTVEEFIFGSGTNLDEQQKAFFVSYCVRNQHDPFKKEVYPIPYFNKKTNRYDLSIITGYEVYLKRAEASGKLDGWVVKFEGSRKDKTLKAIITIYRKDWKFPFEWSTHWFEYAKNNQMWNEKPYTMLRKTVIAQGMRVCFPNETASLPYIAEELGENMVHMGTINRDDEEEKPEGAFEALEEAEAAQDGSVPEKESYHEPQHAPPEEEQKQQELIPPKSQTANVESKEFQTGFTDTACDLPVVIIKKAGKYKLYIRSGDDLTEIKDAPKGAPKKDLIAWLESNADFEPAEP